MRSTSRGSWWILSLAVLAVAMGLVLLQVTRPKERQATRSGRRGAMSAGSRGQGSGTRTGGADPMERWRGAKGVPMGTPARVNRERLARLLGRGMRHGAAGEGDPEARGAGGDNGAGGGGSGGAPGAQDAEDAEDPTIWPLTAKGIKGAIRARIAEIKECYDGWLAADDELGGKLLLAFTIEADPDEEHARISNAEIQQSSLAHPGLERCVLVMAESLRFEPPPGDKITVRYPFQFRSSDD
jgi:hypothetical protein